MKSVGSICCALVIFLLVGVPNHLVAQPAGAKAAAPGDLGDIARRVAAGVGTVQTSIPGGRARVVVFDEYHTSRVGQIEIAVMLLRLYESAGLRTIGLEGALKGPRALDASWFHRLGNWPGGRSLKEDVAVRMLGEGEISAAELMALLFPDIYVHGTELREQYETKLDVKGSPQVAYLVMIAQRKLSQASIAKVNELMATKKVEQALELMLSADPWTKEQYETLKKEGSRPTSCEDMESRLLAIQNRASELGVSVDPKIKADAEKVLAFFRACRLRSVTMANRTFDLAVGANSPVAMNIGAAHTSEVKNFLRSKNASVTVISPLALNPDFGSLKTEEFERKSVGQWARTAPGTLGRLLNTQRKPPPVIDTATGRSVGSAHFASMVIALAAREKKRIPEDIADRIKDLPECKIDMASFAFDGYDVTYRMYLTKTDGRQTEVWARVGSLDTPAATRTLERKLLQAKADLGGRGTVPPTLPPAGTTPASNEGPGDDKRGDVVISRTSLNTLAVYGATKADVNRVGRISG